MIKDNLKTLSKLIESHTDDHDDDPAKKIVDKWDKAAVDELKEKFDRAADDMISAMKEYINGLSDDVNTVNEMEGESDSPNYSKHMRKIDMDVHKAIKDSMDLIDRTARKLGI